MGWEDLVEVAIRTTPEGPWQEEVFLLLSGRDGGVAGPQGEAVERDLLGWRQALPGFDHQQVVEARGCAEDALFVCWPRPDQRPATVAAGRACAIPRVLGHHRTGDLGRIRPCQPKGVKRRLSHQ